MGLIIISVVSFFGIALISSTISGEYKKFSTMPKAIELPEGKRKDYNRLVMKFKRWKSIFELDPSRFIFVRSSGKLIDQKKIIGDFSRANPCFLSESKELYLIDFRFIDYLQYMIYTREIYNKISYVAEIKITKEIAEAMQERLQAILDESQKKIEESLDTQKDIILRLSTGESVKVNRDKGD